MVYTEIFILVFLMSSIFCLIAVFFIWIYVFVYNLKLFIYLKKKKHKRWLEVTEFNKWHGLKPFFTPISSANRILEYIEKDLDIKDKKILQYKKTLRFANSIVIKFLIVFVILFFV